MSTYTLSDIYRYYKADGGELQKSLYKNICQDFNIGIFNHIIYDAGVFDMGFNLSTLSIMRIKRNYKNPQVNWNESNKYKEELLEAGESIYSKDNPDGIKWFIYHDEDWYCRFYWKKSFCKVPNKSAYRFIATRGKQGNKKKLKDHLGQNEINYLKYKNGSIR
jgi:hypothetical protein